MKARDGDAQMKRASNSNPSGVGGSSGRKPGFCPSCRTEVPPQKGFRFSSIKCPKCGTLMGKQ